MTTENSTLASLPGVFNFRDLGGLPTVGGGETRPGIFYRSAALATLTDQGESDLAASDIGVIVDFRIPGERQAQPDRLPTTRPFKVVDLPINTGNMSAPAGTDIPQNLPPEAMAEMAQKIAAHLPSFDDLYRQMLDEGSRDFAQTARLVSQANPVSDSAVLIHCTAGKDRTGVATALILSAVGVEHDAVVADYASSQKYLQGPWADGMLAQMKKFGIPLVPQLVNIVTTTPPEAITSALNYVSDQFGSPAGYLRHGGLTEAELSALKATLI